jgi:hypothetical protein
MLGHNIEADWASAELARGLQASPAFLLEPAPPGGLQAFAGQEAGSSWPHADGLVSIKDARPGGPEYAVAVEYKRHHEGVHGLLTAIGQAHAYLHKGYNAAVIVLPAAYATHADPGAYAASVIESTSATAPIGVVTYRDPDGGSTTPFAGKLDVARKFGLAPARAAGAVIRRTETQWAHIREGSTTRDALYRYLLTARRFDPLEPEPRFAFPPELEAEVAVVSPGSDPNRYLSHTFDDSVRSRIWRRFWFDWLATHGVLTPWTMAGGTFSVSGAATRLLRDDGRGPQMMFAGRSDSIKSVLVRGLNVGALSPVAAWGRFATNVHERAHSYREDIDSGLQHLGLIDAEGRPTEPGYRLVETCERSGGALSQAAVEFVAALLVQNGRLGAFLHYIYRLSEEVLGPDPHRFASNATGSWRFDADQYLAFLETEMRDRLRVLRTVTPRGGAARRRFQAELALLRQYSLVRNFRIGVGLEVNWIRVQEAMSASL